MTKAACFACRYIQVLASSWLHCDTKLVSIALLLTFSFFVATIVVSAVIVADTVVYAKKPNSSVLFSLNRRKVYQYFGGLVFPVIFLLDHMPRFLLVSPF